MGDIEVSGGISSGASGVVDAKAYYGVAADGVTDDTVALQAAINNTPAGYELKLPSGTIMTNQLNIDARISIRGAGKYLTVFKPVAAATGPLFNMNGTAYRPGFSLRDVSFDMTAVPTIAVVYIHQARNGVIENVRVDHGTIGIQLDKCQAMNIIGCEVYDVSVSGFLGSDVNSSGNTFISCLFDATTVGAVAGFDFTAGFDWFFFGCRSLRAPGTALNLQYGWRFVYPTPNQNTNNNLVCCTVDGVTDRTVDSATVAGFYTQGCGNMGIQGTFISANPLADHSPSNTVKIDGANGIEISNSYLSGMGIQFTGTASDATAILNNRFNLNDANASASMVRISTTPTNVDFRGNSLATNSGLMQITDTASTFYAALLREAQSAAGLSLNRPTGALFETQAVDITSTITGALTSGTLYLFSIWLPKGLRVTNINWATGSTPLTNNASPHYWVALFNNVKALLRQSTDDTAATIGASAIKTTALSSVFTTTYEGMHYLGIMVASGGGTQPTYAYYAAASGITNLSIVRSATADTGLTATAPNPAGATSNIGQRLYAYVT